MISDIYWSETLETSVSTTQTSPLTTHLHTVQPPAHDKKQLNPKPKTQNGMSAGLLLLGRGQAPQQLVGRSGLARAASSCGEGLGFRVEGPGR